MFAGWYTPKFCKNVVDAFEEEFRLEDEAEQRARKFKQHTTLPVRRSSSGRAPETQTPKVRQQTIKVPAKFSNPLGQRYFGVKDKKCLSEWGFGRRAMCV